ELCDHVVRQAVDDAAIGPVDLESPLDVIGQGIDDAYVLLARAIGAEYLSDSYVRVARCLAHLAQPLLQIGHVERPCNLSVRSAERLAEPALLGRQIGVIPPVRCCWLC